MKPVLPALLPILLLSLFSCKNPVESNSPPNPISGITPDTFKFEYYVEEFGTFLYQNGISDPDGDAVTVIIVDVVPDDPAVNVGTAEDWFRIDGSTFGIYVAPPSLTDYMAMVTFKVFDGQAYSSESDIPLYLEEPPE